MASKKSRKAKLSDGSEFKNNMITHEHDAFRVRRPFKERNPRTDLVILVAIIAIFALVIMFLQFPR